MGNHVRYVSSIHTTAYSIIAIQEMNLNYYYPPIFWATARLMCESGSTDFLAEDLELLSDDDEDSEEAEQTSVNYFKMGSAIGKIKQFGVEIAPPSINKSTFTFKPVVEENTIYFGLKGLSRVGNSIIYEIIANRPYTSLRDFLSKVKVNKIQATMLIKSGAFDEFGEREQLMQEYCELEADTKQRLTLQNAQRLIDLNLIPEELKEYQDIYRLTKHLKKYFKCGDYIVPDDNMWSYINLFDFEEIEADEESGDFYIAVKEWEKWYKKKMEVLKQWIKENESELLQQMNNIAIQELLDKYAPKNRAAGEMEALSFYHSKHELDYPEYEQWLKKMQVSNFHQLPEEPEIEWQADWNENIKKFKLHRIVGTAIGRDKQKGIVGILTPDGFLTVRVHKSMFNRLDKQIKDETQTEKSWFSKGSKLLISGYRMGDEFKVKTYKNHPFGQAIYKIIEPGKITSKRMGE